MATSPPFSATSPILSKKRPFAASSPHPHKRRKPSTGPSQLRQTSYPPDEPQADLRDETRSPSVDVETTSMISGVTGGAGRRRRGNKAASVISSNAVGPGTPGAKGQEEEADEDEEDEVEDAVEGKMDEAEKERNRQRMAVLFDRLPEDEQHRFEQWRGVRLKREIVRRITNQTLSQSVPQSVVISIHSYTKAFLADIIDRARDVQEEWMASAPEADRSRPIAERIHDRDKGPLTPDMMREALRRYKRDRVGGAAGFMGLSLQGKEYAAPKMNGRRLFR